MDKTMRDHLDEVIEALLTAEAQAERAREKAGASNRIAAGVMLAEVRSALVWARGLRDRMRKSEGD